jgi:hypothetical protein
LHISLRELDDSEYKFPEGHSIGHDDLLHIPTRSLLYVPLCFLEEAEEPQEIEVEVTPVASDTHYHVVDHVVDVADDVVGLLARDVIWVVGLELFEHELIEEELVESVEFGKVLKDRFAMRSEDHCVSYHVYDVFSVVEAANLEIRLKDSNIIIVF